MKKYFKLFSRLRNNRGEVDGSGEPEEKEMQDLIEDAMSEGDTDNDKPAGENEDDGKPQEEEGGEAGKEGEDEGEGEKNKGEEEEEDPEIELGYDASDGVKAKMKMSEVRSTLKWLKDNNQSIAGAMKLRELAIKNPEFGKMMNQVISKSVSEDGQLNPEFISNTLKSLEVKADKIEDKIEDKDEDIDEAEALLEELDPDSSQAMVLKKNIRIMKAQKKQLADALKKIDDISQKLDGIDKKHTESNQARESEARDKEVSRIKDMFDRTVNEQTKEGYSFVDSHERGQFLNEVKKIVSGQPDKIGNDDSFKKIVSEAVKAAYKKIEDRRQSVIADYLKKKGDKPKVKRKEDNIPDAEDKDMSQETLENILEEQLSQEE